MATTSHVSVDILADKLQPLGWVVSPYIDLDKNMVKFQKNDFVWETPRTTVHYPCTDDRRRSMTADKLLCQKIAHSVGLTVPETTAFRSSVYDEAILQQLVDTYKTLVVKPDNSRGSVGLTIGVQDTDALSVSIATALRVKGARAALVQKFYTGSEYRFTILDGRVVSVIERQKPHVIGDGTSRIVELIDTENKQRHNINKFSLLHYPDIANVEIEDAQRVPLRGEKVQLGDSPMVRNGASLYEVVDDIHVSYRELAEKLAQEIPLYFMTVDMLIDNMVQPAKPDSYCFLEANSAPSLAMYNSTRNNQDKNVVGMLVQKIDKFSNK